MKKQILFLSALLSLPLSLQAQSLQCFSAVNGIEFKGFVMSETDPGSELKNTLSSTFESSELEIKAVRSGVSASFSVSILDKSTGVLATAVGWPKADVSLSVPRADGSIKKIEAVCIYYRQ